MLTLEMAIQKIQQFPPEKRNKVIEFIEFLEFQSDRAVAHKAQKEFEKPSFAEAAHEFIGCLDSDIEDLSHNPQYLEGFGK
jgi:hemerythrin superfamily protein